MGTINTSLALDDLERTLRSDAGLDRCRDALEILARWQRDQQLDGESRERARRLLEEFRRNFRQAHS